MSGHLVDVDADSDFFFFSPARADSAIYFDKYISIIFKDGGDHFLFDTMDAGNGESARDLDPQLVTHLNLQPLAIDLSTVILVFSKFLVMSSDNKRNIGLLSLC